MQLTTRQPGSLDAGVVVPQNEGDLGAGGAHDVRRQRSVPGETRGGGGRSNAVVVFFLLFLVGDAEEMSPSSPGDVRMFMVFSRRYGARFVGFVVGVGLFSVRMVLAPLWFVSLGHH